MSERERDDQSIDHELAGIAMAASHEHEQTVSANEAGAALNAVRSRIAAGDLGGVPPSIPMDSSTANRRSPWVRFGAIAAVLAMVALGLVAVVGGGTTNDVMTPATVPETPDPTTPATVPSAIDVPTTEPAPVTSPTTEPAPVTSPTIGAPDTTVESSVRQNVPPDETDPPSQAPDASPTGDDEARPTPAPAPVDNGLVQPTAIRGDCVEPPGGCPQLALTETGRIVGFDDADTFRVYDEDGTELQAEVELAESVAELNPFLVAVGPDDVAYLVVDEPEISDPVGSLLAIPLVGSNAGDVVMEWEGRSRSGDSSLISRKSGLTVVPCCGPRVPRPDPDATVYGWVDRNGAIVESTAPSFDLNLGDAGNSLTRIDTLDDGAPAFTPFSLPTALQYPRDFPRVVATDDGGALAVDQIGVGMFQVLVDFDPAAADDRGALDNDNVYYRRIDGTVVLLEPSGTVIVSDRDDGLARRTLDEIATPGWPGEIITDRTDQGDGLGSTRAPGLNDHIDAEQPFWAGDPELFALQIKARVGPNERVSIEYDIDAESPVITITTSGFLDDSVAASQRVIVTERADDGLLRFVSGSYGVRCRPGRGHQDFSIELCV